MGLYDDDANLARESEVYREAKRLCDVLRSVGSVKMQDLVNAVEGISAVTREHPVLEDVDSDFQVWRSECVAVGRKIRERATADSELRKEWDAFTLRHQDFAALLDGKDGFQKYERTQGRSGFHFYYPEGWELNENVAGARVVVGPDLNARESFHVVMEALPSVPSPERFAADSIEKLRKEIPGCNIDDRRFRKLNQGDAYEVTFAFQENEQVIRGRQVFAVKGNVSYTLTFVAGEERFDSLSPLAREIEESFTVVSS